MTIYKYFTVSKRRVTIKNPFSLYLLSETVTRSKLAFDMHAVKLYYRLNKEDIKNYEKMSAAQVRIRNETKPAIKLPVHLNIKVCSILLFRYNSFILYQNLPII